MARNYQTITARHADEFDGTPAEHAELEAIETALGVTVRAYRPAELAAIIDGLEADGWAEIYRHYYHAGEAGNILAYHRSRGGFHYVDLYAPEGEATAQIVASAVKAARAAFEKIAA